MKRESRLPKHPLQIHSGHGADTGDGFADFVVRGGSSGCNTYYLRLTQPFRGSCLMLGTNRLMPDGSRRDVDCLRIFDVIGGNSMLMNQGPEVTRVAGVITSPHNHEI